MIVGTKPNKYLNNLQQEIVNKFLNYNIIMSICNLPKLGIFKCNYFVLVVTLRNFISH